MKAAVDQGLFQQLLNAEGGNAGVRAAAAVERTLLFLALVVLVGGLVFLVAVWPDGASDDRLRPTLRAAAVWHMHPACSETFLFVSLGVYVAVQR